MKEELIKELKQAMIDKDELRKNTITMLRAAILQVEKDTQKELSGDDMVAIVAREVKKRKEALIEFEKAGREDISSNLIREIEILSKYLPEQLEEDSIRNIVRNAIEKTGASSMKDMGKVMQFIKPEVASKADGKLVSDIVKEMLS